MGDKNLMENILLLEKGTCDLYLHGTMEASTKNVHNVFDNALSDSLCMQDEVYSKMAAKGWYPAEEVEQTKIANLKQKYSLQ